jgi:hypothetical protein
VAWPAFGVLVLTGVWNVAEAGVRSGAYRTTLIAKLAAVLVSGVAAYAHGRARNRGTMAWTGALTGLAALVALLLGIVLAG